jgi:hypothetical protein
MQPALDALPYVIIINEDVHVSQCVLTLVNFKDLLTFSFSLKIIR